MGFFYSCAQPYARPALVRAWGLLPLADADAVGLDLIGRPEAGQLRRPRHQPQPPPGDGGLDIVAAHSNTPIGPIQAIRDHIHEW